jgi:hypothetical protein
MIPMVPVIAPYICPVFIMWVDYPDDIVFVCFHVFFAFGEECSACLFYVYQKGILSISFGRSCFNEICIFVDIVSLCFVLHYAF